MKKNVILSLFLLATIQLQAQVTIGSNTTPVQGSLLQLKENDEASANASKGLGLPRVQLSNLNKLKMGSFEITDPTEKINHAGLVVYNVTGDVTCPTIEPGLFVWDASKWSRLGPEVTAAGVSILTDGRDGEQYRYRSFGAVAGEWMLENMRYIDPSFKLGSADDGLVALAGDRAKLRRYYYPQPESPGNLTDVTKIPNWRKEHGLFYSYAAATMGANDLISLANGNNVGEPKVQGICPTGWHVPTDYEWSQLEEEVATNPQKYSSWTTPTQWDISYYSMSSTYDSRPNDNYNGGPGHGVNMKSICPLPINYPYLGRSLRSPQGGFDIYLIGSGGYGATYTYSIEGRFWTSSTEVDPLYAFVRTFHHYKDGALRYTIGRINNFSVRCKRGGSDVLNHAQTVTLDIPLVKIYSSKTTGFKTPSTQQVNATILPADAVNKDVLWTTADPAIATVSAKGLVTAVADGRTTLVATSADGNKVGSIPIIVGCGAFVAPDQWKVFKCHNVGADTYSDPFIPKQNINGGFYQWGRTTQVANTGSPTTANPMGTPWNTIAAADGAWLDTSPMGNNPCPAGFRVPTKAEWDGVFTNNTNTSIGTWSTVTTDVSKYDAGRKLGDALFLPATGYRADADGALVALNYNGSYWSTTPHSTDPTQSWRANVHNTNSTGVGTFYGKRNAGYSVRCIAGN